MCGRFTLVSPSDVVRSALALDSLPDLFRRYNVAPTQRILIVRAGDSGREASFVRWGLVPSWSREGPKGAPLLNARAESVAVKAAFRSAYKSRRCLVAADGWYEWKPEGKGKRPFHFSLPGRAVFAIAGLWERWVGPDGEAIESAALLTTDANDAARIAHDRMPVILAGHEEQSSWLDLTRDPSALLRPFAGGLEAAAVGTFVSSARNEGPACLEPA